MEQLYQDFTTKLLPKIQEGLTITKDYFIDLFGRYVKYLIVMDSIQIVVSLIIGCVAVFFIIKAVKSDDTEYGGWAFWRLAVLVVGSIVAVTVFCWFFDSLSNLIKDIYIPEVRILEEINMLDK